MQRPILGNLRLAFSFSFVDGFLVESFSLNESIF